MESRDWPLSPSDPQAGSLGDAIFSVSEYMSRKRSNPERNPGFDDMATAGGGGYVYTAAEVEGVVNTLYGDPSRVQEASQWLTAFQESQSAWEVSVSLMQSQALNIKFFAANTMHHKIRRDYDELPPNASDSLMETLFGILQQSETSAQQQILTKVCLAAVALSLHFTKVEGKFQTAILENPRFLSLPLAPALEFLLLLPQEFESSKSNLTKRRTDEALAQFSRMVPHVIGLIQQPLTGSEDDSVRMKCLEALAGWCKFGVSVTNLRQSQLYPLVVSFLQHPVLCKPACEVFEAAVNTESYPAEPDELILEIVSLVVSLRPLYSRAAASGNDAYCEGVCNLTKSLMIRRPELLASGGGECLALADFCLEMTGHTNRGVSEAALEFWDELQCIEMPTRHESLRRDVFASLVKVLAKCAAYSPDVDDEDEDGDDDFNMYRRRVEEALLNCACCLRSGCLTILCNLLGSAGDKWQEWESILYSMTCISGEILTLQMQSEREVILNNITTLLTGFIFPAAHPQHELVRRAALRVMESYSKCLQQNLALVEPSLLYILPLLPIRKLHPQVARAFAGVCSKGRLYLSKPETLNKLILAITGRYGEVQKEGMQLCVEALGRVLSVLGPAEMVESLKGLVSPFVERLRALTAGQGSMFIRASALLEAADLVKLIGASIRFLEPPETAAGDTHPVTAVLHEAWPVLDAVCTKFLDTAVSEAVQGLFVNALRQAKAEAHPLLHSMMGACLSTYRSSKCGACLESVGVAVEIFGSMQGAAQNFGGLAVELSSITFEMIQSGGVATSPDVITAYFEMCYRFLLFCPDALVAQASFPSTMDLSLACIPLKEKEPLRAIFCFIERAAAIPSPMWESCAAPWFNANGAGLYKALILSLSDSCPPEAIPRLSPLLFSLNARMAGHAQHWMVAALSAPDYPVPPNILDDTAKKHFVQANANLASNQRRFLAMIQDFAQICRQQQTSDALVAYQM